MTVRVGKHEHVTKGPAPKHQLSELDELRDRCRVLNAELKESEKARSELGAWIRRLEAEIQRLHATYRKEQSVREQELASALEVSERKLSEAHAAIGGLKGSSAAVKARYEAKFAELQSLYNEVVEHSGLLLQCEHGREQRTCIECLLTRVRARRLPGV